MHEDEIDGYDPRDDMFEDEELEQYIREAAEEDACESFGPAITPFSGYWLYNTSEPFKVIDFKKDEWVIIEIDGKRFKVTPSP